MKAPPEPPETLFAEYKAPKEPVSRYDLPQKEPDAPPTRYPRLRGAGIFFVGLVLLFAALGSEGTSGKAVCMTPILLLWGGWTMLVGEPLDDNGRPASWAQVGAWICGVAGIALAIVLAFALSRH